MPSTSGRLFWGAEGVGAEVTNTQERTAAAQALPQLDSADERAQRGQPLRKSQVHGSQQAQADLEGHGAPQR
jgi:hypothetical protein